MDPAQEFEAVMLSRQKPMNDVIDRGDSAVQQFYCGAALFVTGGSGFLGKQLIEKLFRSCKIKKMFLLLRSKKEKTMQERLEYMLEDPMFDTVREKQPDFADRIVPVEGDVGDVRLGLSNKDWTMITQEVDMVLHLAATIRFDEPLRMATLTNVRGTRETLALARECKQLRNYVYVSTAYTHATYNRIGKEVLEQFYPAPVPPDVLIGLAETMDEDRLNNITPDLIKGWPNTYTFTKAVAEEVVRTTGGDMPVCVVKPPIVMCSYLEPSPGWTEWSCVMGAFGIPVGVATGVLHVLLVDVKKRLAIVPVDFVNNAIIAAGWDAAERRRSGDTDIPVYTIANQDKFMSWDEFIHLMHTECSKLFSAKSVWFCSVIETKNRLVFWLLTWLLHYIPAYVLDGVCTVIPLKPKKMPSLTKIYSKVYKLSSVLSYFVTNEWDLKDDNVQAMIKKMSDNDKAIFNCDLTTVNAMDYIKTWAIGIRKYILKDGLKYNELENKRQRILSIANYGLLALYIYVSWIVFRVFWTIVKFGWLNNIAISYNF